MKRLIENGPLTVSYETPTQTRAIESLLDTSFGAKRQQKVSYRYRDGVAPLPELCFTALKEDTLVGTVRHWPLTLTGCDLPAVLLGPIAVDPTVRDMGVGAGLMGTAIAHARAMGRHMILLVGDPDYYERFGFLPAEQFGLTMPGEQPHRVLVRPLTPEGWSLSSGGIILPVDHAPTGPEPLRARLSQRRRVRLQTSTGAALGPDTGPSQTGAVILHA
ncbi:MAG: GNAT family N-acetyltransferase [Rhodospirillaceae bacterium]